METSIASELSKTIIYLCESIRNHNCVDKTTAELTKAAAELTCAYHMAMDADRFNQLKEMLGAVRMGQTDIAAQAQDLFSKIPDRFISPHPERSDFALGKAEESVAGTTDSDDKSTYQFTTGTENPFTGR